jgi:hypothetical protein
VTDPTPPTGGEPVRFDDGAAGTLASALDELVDELTRFRRAADLHAELARQDWVGYTRRWFDDQVADLLALARATGHLAEDERAAVERARAWATAELQRRLDEAAAAAAAAPAVVVP